MSKITDLLGANADDLLNHTCKTITKDNIVIPSGNFIDQTFAYSNRSPQVLRSLQQLYGNGRLANTGYMSILPVDQGIEHSAGASFAPNPIYFDSENIVKLAHEGGCNAVASTYGVLASVARKYAHKIPFIVKINHNEFLTYPDKFDQITLDYLSSEFHRFDACIMSLKKIGDYHFQSKNQRFVTDLGAAAYILMHKYKVLGKKGKAIYFEIEEDGCDKFDELSLEYLSSDFHRFDSCLMSLKKINEYMSNQIN